MTPPLARLTCIIGSIGRKTSGLSESRRSLVTAVQRQQQQTVRRWTEQLSSLAQHRALFCARTFIRRIRSGPASGHLKGKAEPSRAAVLVRPTVFTATVCSCSFIGAAIWQYENVRAMPGQMLNKMKDLYVPKAGSFRNEINKWWHSLSAAQQVAVGIISLNVVVFAAWKLAGDRMGFLVKYFSGSPFGDAPSLAMIGSMFSHASFFHLAANMYVLYTFCGVAVHIFGKEQFVGFYLSAGVVSALASYAVKVIQSSRALPSLGASGAILGVLGAVCTTLPEARLQIAFVGDLFPHSFSADTAMKCLIAFDALGLVLGWRMFDHAAHLGGVLFGIWYVKYGHNMIWKRRDAIQRRWHQWRGEP